MTIKFYCEGVVIMKKKTMSIWLVALLIGAIFTVVFFGNVSAMNDEQNLSGLVWQADGTPPTGP